MTPAAAPSITRIMAMAILVVASSAVGVMLLGAGIGDIGPDLGIGAAELGMLTAVFFAAAAVTSAQAGRVVARIGWQRAIRINSAIIGTLLLVIAAFVSNPWAMALALAAMGATYSLANPAANQALADHVHPKRRATFFGLKHGGIPTATLLAGGAVPLIILNFGWRTAYVVAALLAYGLLAVVPSGGIHATAQHEDEDPRRTVQPLPTASLYKVALGAMLATIGVVALSTFLVASLVADGFSQGPAGWLQFGGSLVSISARAGYGLISDRTGGKGFGLVATLFGIGAIVYAAWIPSTGAVLGALVILAYATGWGWPGLLTYSVVNANPTTAAASSGISQSGIFAGAALGPLIVGQIIERASFDASWAFITGCLLAATAVMTSVSRNMVDRQTGGSRS